MKSADWMRYAFARLGWPGGVGLLLLAACCLTYGLAVVPIQDARMALLQRADVLAKQARSVREIESNRQAEQGATLPGAERMPEAVAQIFTSARHAGLSLQQGTYRAVGEKPAGQENTGLLRYRISLPVSGNYPAVRAFVAEALEREPSLALDGMRLARERMELGVIDAELRFTLYLASARVGDGQ